MVALLEQLDKVLDIPLCLIEEIVRNDDDDLKTALLGTALIATAPWRRGERVGDGIAADPSGQLVEKIRDFGQLDELRGAFTRPDVRGGQE